MLLGIPINLLHKMANECKHLLAIVFAKIVAVILYCILQGSQFKSVANGADAFRKTVYEAFLSIKIPHNRSRMWKQVNMHTG